MKYWEIGKLQMSSKEVEDFIKYNFNAGNKTRIGLHEHSCGNRRYPKLEVGKQYYIDTSHPLDTPKYEKCKITDIRSGVVFYIVDGEKVEKHFEEFSLIHYFAEPSVIDVNLDEEYYEVISASGKMKVNYLVKL